MRKSTREALRDVVIAAVKRWSDDSGCGCYPMCASCARMQVAIDDLKAFEAKGTTPLAFTGSMADPPDSREAMGDESDFEEA